MAQPRQTYPRPAVLSGIPIHRHTVIEASAGTGKTFTLEHLVVELLVRRGVQLDDVLVVTFTDKATREMRVRVRDTIRAILAAPVSAAEPTAGRVWTIDGPARERLRRALFAFDRAPISTIHAFCQRVLAEHAFDSCRLFEQQQVEARDAFARAFREQVRAALVHPELAPVLQLALETSTMAQLEQLLFAWHRERAEPMPPFEPAVALAALGQLPAASRLAGALGVQLARTLHASPAKTLPPLVQQLAALGEELRSGELSPERALVAYWRWAATRATKKLPALEYVRQYAPRAARAEPAVRPLVANLLQLFDAGASPLGALLHQLLPRVQTHLDAVKRGQGQLDFDDMLLAMRRALEGPSGPALLAELRRRYRYALVDEFQDTDEVQWDIFRKIFCQSEQGHVLFVIGDPKQAIYGFRNADVHTYRQARTSLLAGEAEPVRLVDNYRSTEPLIAAHNLLFSQGFFTGANRAGPPVRCGDRSRALLDPVGGVAGAVKLVHLYGHGMPDGLGVARTASDLFRPLVAFVSAEITRLLDPSDPASLRLREGGEERVLGPADIYVLTRTGSEGQQVGEAFRQAGIPHAFFKREGLYQSSEARELRDVLAAVADPDDPTRRLRAWLTPLFAVPLAALPACRELGESHPLVQLLYRWHGMAAEHDWGRLCRALLDESGLARRELFGKSSRRALTNYEQLLESVLELAHRGRVGVDELVARLDAIIAGRAAPPGNRGNVERCESDAAAVQILTMHKAKGLEAPVVFLCGGLSAGRSVGRDEPHVYHEQGQRRAWLGAPPPELGQRIARERVEEDERLLYVALTRAKGRLYVPYVGPPPAEQQRSGAVYDLSVSGCQCVLNDRLRALVAQGVTREPGSAWALVDVGQRVPAPSSPPPQSLAAWQPTAGLPTPPADLAARLRQRRAAHAGFVITSYTRLAHGARSARASSPVSGDPGEEFVAETHDAPIPELEPGQLPGGATTGVFLHELLEHLSFEAAREASDFDSWRELPDVVALFAECARRSGVDTCHVPAAQQLVWATLRAPLRLGSAKLDGGLCALQRRVPEMSLLYPIPEPSHPPAGLPDGSPLLIDRGFVRGVVDLVFEHAGRTWFVDYKSDRLAAYSPAALATHVQQRYGLQARLYTLGVVRLLAIRERVAYEERFGGLLYCFMRGMAVEDGDGRHGVCFERPSWEQLAQWEQELRSADEPFGCYLGRPRRLGSAPAAGGTS